MKIEIILLTILGLYIIWTIVELIEIHRFNLKFFNYGLKIFSRKLNFRFSNWRNFDGIYSEKEAKYAFIPELKTGYFVTKFSFYRHYSLFASSKGMPLTIFGKFTESENEIMIEYKISYRLVLLFSILIIALTIIPFLSGQLIAFAIVLIGILVLSGLIYISYLFLQGKMLIISDEIEEKLKIKK